MKMVILDGYTLNPGDLSWQTLEQIGDLTVYDRTDPEQAAKRIGDAQIVFTNKTPLDEAVFEQCGSLSYIGVLATGYNVVDVERAGQRGIVVTNIPSYGTDSVAQFTIALLLELCHHVGLHSDSVKAGEWSGCDDWCYWKRPLIELAGKTMGIIGLGRIGQGTGRIAQALGMRILAYDRYRDEALEDAGFHYTDLDTLFSASDVVVLHCPLLPETKGIINKNTISRMKDGVMIINDSRGPLIVEEDLAQALASGKVGGAAVDVVSTEPIQSGNPLLTAPNIIITPHIAWAPRAARQRLLDLAVDNLKAYLAGRPKNVVNSLNV